MKKICIITTVKKTFDWFFIQQARELIRKGYDVYAIHSPDKSYDHITESGITYIPVKMSRGLDLRGILVFFKLKMLFRKYKFDIIQYSSPNASLYASLAGFFSGIKIRVYRQWGLYYVNKSGLKRLFFKKMERITCRFSTKILPDSKSNLNLSIKEKLYTWEKGEVILNGSAAGVNIQRFSIEKKQLWRQKIREELGINKDSYLVGYIGRINKDKGIKDLVDAFNMLLKRYDEMYMILIGSIESEDFLRDILSNDNKNKEHMIYLNEVPNPELYYSALDLFVLPSHREGFGTVLLEASAMQVPIIAADINGPKDFIKHFSTGLLFESKNVNDLYSKIEYCFINNIKVNEMVEKSFDNVLNNYNEDYVIKGNIDFIEGILKRD